MFGTNRIITVLQIVQFNYKTAHCKLFVSGKYRLGSSYKPVKHINVVNPTAVPQHFQERQSEASQTITQIIKLSILPHCQNVTPSEKSVTNVARKRGVWLYILQHNGITHMAFFTIDRSHLQRGPIGQLHTVILILKSQ